MCVCAYLPKMWLKTLTQWPLKLRPENRPVRMTVPGSSLAAAALARKVVGLIWVFPKMVVPPNHPF